MIWKPFRSSSSADFKEDSAEWLSGGCRSHQGTHSPNPKKAHCKHCDQNQNWLVLRYYLASLTRYRNSLETSANCVMHVWISSSFDRRDVATKILIVLADLVDPPFSIGSTKIELAGDYSIGRREDSRLMKTGPFGNRARRQ